MSINYEQLKKRIDTLFENTKPDGETGETISQVIVDGFLNTWKLCEKDGLTTPDIFIDLLTIMADNLAMQYRGTEGLKAYGQETKDRGIMIAQAVDDGRCIAGKGMWPDNWSKHITIDPSSD